MKATAASKTLAIVRIATGIFFLFFAEYKLADSVFARVTFPQQWLHDFIDNGAVGFYRLLLERVVMPHHVFFGYAAGVVELFIGLCLVAGILVKPASVLGMLHMINLTLATWWQVEHGVPVWRYFGAELDHLPLLFLFLIFYSADAGRTWGIDSLRRQSAQSFHAVASD